MLLSVAASALCTIDSAWARVNEQALRGRALWDGPQPSASFAPREVLGIVVDAMRRNGEPRPHSGTACLLRFSTPDFVLAGAPGRLSPEALTDFMVLTQYGLLLDAEGGIELPSDCLELDDNEAFQDMALFGPAGPGDVEAKLGWTLKRGGGGWRIDSLTWHDFRPTFRPGIGQEEWPRICG